MKSYVFVAFYVFSSLGNALSTIPSYLKCSDIPRCTCQQLNDSVILANCTGLHLKKIPVFKTWVTHIDLSFNKIEGIFRSPCIPSTVKYSDISHNSIMFIERNVISSLHKLEFLDFSYNRQLNFVVLLNISKELPFTSVKILKFNGIHCQYGVGTRVYRDLVQNWNETSLREIHGSGNRIEKIERNVISSFPSTVEVINFSDNRFLYDSFFFEILEMPNIRLINISHQNNEPAVYIPVSRILQSCTDKVYTPPCLQDKFYQPNPKPMIEGFHFSQVLRMKKINISIFFPSSLVTLDLSHSMINFKRLSVPMNVMFKFPSLREFYFQGNIIPELYSVDLFPRTIEHVDLSNNFCSRIDPWYFADGYEMKTLNLAGNILGDFLESINSSSIFLNLGKLQYLDLSRNRIRKMNNEILLPLRNLKHLDLSSNNIETVSFPLYIFLRLEVLDLSNNRIRFLSSQSIKDLDLISKSPFRMKPVSVYLNGNVLQCTCETFKFLAWMLQKSDEQILFPKMKEYKCRLSNLTLVTFDKIEGVVDELRMKCISSIVLDIVGVISGLFVVIFLSILIPTILYRHRWRIRYLFFAAKRVFRSSKPNSSIHRPFSFDVFLSYADEDRVFVHSVILKGLESDENSLSVCCHLRDFTDGRPIAENIADAIFLSRYTVCVLSEHYLNSYWCMYEYNLARMETKLTRGDEDAVILVIMDDFKCHLDKSPLTLLAHIKAKSYLEVPPINEEECVQTFVLRLKHAIGTQ